MIGSWWRRLWWPSGTMDAPSRATGAAASAVTVAVRRERVAAPPRRSKRGRDETTTSYCSPDKMNQGTDRLASVKSVTFCEDAQQGILRVCFSPAKRGPKMALAEEEYDWIRSAEEVRAQIALKAGATLLTLAMDEPALFWNAVHWCQGDLERVEREMLL